MELVYNVYFELSAGFFILFLLLFVRTRYDLTLERNKFFYHMICCLLAVDVLDVVTACTISYGAIVPKGLNVLVNTIYFALNGLLGYLYTNYCQQYNNIYRRNRFIYMLSQVLLFGYWVLLLINTFTGLLFYFDQNGNYCHGILYLSVYIMPYIFFLMSACFMFMAFPQFNINQRVCIIMFLIVSASGGVLQLIWFPDVLLNVFTISLGITIVLFSLETPEYQQLLISQIREILKFAGNEEVTIYIDPADRSCLSSLTAAVNHPLTVSEYSFSGGTRAVIPGRHILIDNSFAAKFDAAKKNFTFDGGVLHE